MYYAICNVNGPISVRLGAVDDFDSIDQRAAIDEPRMDAEDDLGIAGENMTEDEFAASMKAAGYAPVSYPDGNVKEGWVIWGPANGA